MTTTLAVRASRHAVIRPSPPPDPPITFFPPQEKPILVVDETPVRTRDSRLAAAVDACAGCKASAWAVAETSGFLRLDAALDCVIRRIELVAGWRDRSAVVAEAMLPIVFRLR